MIELFVISFCVLLKTIRFHKEQKHLNSLIPDFYQHHYLETAIIPGSVLSLELEFECLYKFPWGFINTHGVGNITLHGNSWSNPVAWR